MKKINISIGQKEGVSDIQQIDTTRNNLKVRVTKLKYVSNKKTLNEILYATGNEKRCWITDGISDTKLQKEIQKEIEMTVSSLVVKPFNESSDEMFGVMLKSDKLKFVGVGSTSQGTGFFTYYSTDGIWHPIMKSTSIYTGFFVSEKLENDPLFKQRLGDVALRLIPQGYKFLEFVGGSTKEIDGKLAIFYKSKAINKKEEILVTSVFYQKSNTKLPIVLVHIQPKGKSEIIDWETALKGIVIK